MIGAVVCSIIAVLYSIIAGSYYSFRNSGLVCAGFGQENDYFSEENLLLIRFFVIAIHSCFYFLIIACLIVVFIGILTCCRRDF